MATKYPILLVHGLMLKDGRTFKAFGRIERFLRARGETVFTSDADGVGSIENNALQLSRQIKRILRKTGASKVNLIAHSKGGLDSRYMIDHLGMGRYVASVTFLCTPHYGSAIASGLYGLPAPIRGCIAFGINTFYRLNGDKNPDVLTVCRQLRSSPRGVLPSGRSYDGIYLQSYSTTLDKSRDDFVMGIPLIFSKRYESSASDGLVAEDSCRYGEYKGRCTDSSVSHTQIVDLLVMRKKREKIFSFYLKLCRDLRRRGL